MSLQPRVANVQPGGSVAVDVVINPPPETVAVWVVEVHYDPQIVAVTGCTSAATPRGMVGTSDCRTKDTDSDGVDDTAQALGAWLAVSTELGFADQQMVATFTFQAVGGPRHTSPLRITKLTLADGDGQPVSASTRDGRINVIGRVSPGRWYRPCWVVTPQLCQPPIHGEALRAARRVPALVR